MLTEQEIKSLPMEFMEGCSQHVKAEGIPWTTVSKKTGLSYNRLRSLRSGKVALTFVEFVILAQYCKLDYSRFLPANKEST